MKIGYNALRLWIRLGMFFYFKKIKVFGKDNIPHDKPIMLLANHQNALMDALMIVIYSGLTPYFLARSDLFKKPLIKRFLNYLQMIPIYRFRDGVETLKNNPAIFKKCGELLGQGKTVMLFPEGNHGLKRKVRLPMRKGFARMIFSALEEHPELDIRILPVGLNYKDAANFPDSTSMHIGKDFRVQDFYDPEDLSGTESKLKAEVYKRLKTLTTHIENEDAYENVISQLEDRGEDFLNPQKVNSIIANLDPLHKSEGVKKKSSGLAAFADVIFGILNFPLLLFWNGKVKNMANDIEFRATLRFMTGFLLFPLYCLLLFVVFRYAIGQNFAFAFFLAHVAFNLAYVKLK